MQRALILMHNASEGPGTLGEFLAESGFGIETVHLYGGNPIPEDRDFDLIVSLGGPMNVYEDDKYPFLAEEAKFLARAIEKGEFVVGVCLGAQMIARAAGAKVYRSPVEEIGWRKVQLTGQGKADELFTGLPEELDVFQWHGDTFDLPEEASLLVTGDECPHQAFRVKNAWGLQFHIEVNSAIIESWFEDDRNLTEILKTFDSLESDYLGKAYNVYINLLMALRGGV